MGAALLVEILSWCGVGSVVGAGALFAFGAGFVRGDGGSALLSVGSMVVAAGSALGVLVLLVLDRGRLPARIRAQFPRGEGSIVPVALPAWHLLHFLAWVASGALLGLSVGAATSAAFAIGGLLCVAIVGGFVALFAPAGAGVREAMVALGAAPLVGAPAAITISIVGRAISLLSDVALFGYFRWRARQASGR
jgi:hypothetical protein